MPLRLPPIWNHKALKMRVAHLYCAFSYFPFFLCSSFVFFLLWRSPQCPYLPLAILPRFPSPFSNVLCSFKESSKKSEEQEEEAPPQEADIGPLPFFTFSYFTFLPWFFPAPPPF